MSFLIKQASLIDTPVQNHDKREMLGSKRDARKWKTSKNGLPYLKQSSMEYKKAWFILPDSLLPMIENE